MNINLNSGSPEETFSIGNAIGEVLRGDELILLSGNLGAGKTMLTKGIGHSLGIERREIVSPSYTLMNIYEGKFTLFHIDLYRIGEQLIGGIPEIDDNLDNGIIVVEWAEYIKKYYSGEKNLIDISILLAKDEEPGRKISISTDINIHPDVLSGN
ncbi:MAG: tRNA (adenosine(37)-N6)-threonylcarbamoyltransferase complex ATPase subunit type 1 TsaE [Acidobacteriota bacterium]